MKKIISLIILIFLIATSLPAQKVNFTLNSPRIVDSLFLVDVYANILSGQTWNVGPTNIRIKYWTLNPENGISFRPESPVTNANSNLSGNTSYFEMSSTSILYDSAVSLNIQLLLTKTPYVMTTSGILGTLKFRVNSSNSCIRMQILPISAVFNTWSPIGYPTDWTYYNSDSCLIPVVGISGKTEEVPDDYKLSQNYPNPFNPTTSIKFSMPKSGLVTLKVYDILGREVSELVNQFKSAGTYIVDFDASSLTTGMYFYKIEVNDFVMVKKMVLVK